MDKDKGQMSWQEELLRLGKKAFQAGLELRFAVSKRQGIRKWRIYLSRMEKHGEEEVVEED